MIAFSALALALPAVRDSLLLVRTTERDTDGKVLYRNEYRYWRDARGGLAQERLEYADTAFQGRRTTIYDISGRIWILEYAGAGSTVLDTISYRVDGRPTRSAVHITGAGVDSVAASVYSYDASGRLTRTDLVDAAGKAYWSMPYEYDGSGRLSRRREIKAGATVHTWLYRYAGADTLAVQVSELDSAGDTSFVTTTAYDAGGRKVRENLSDPKWPALSSGHGWEYALDGRITKETYYDRSGKPTSYVDYEYAAVDLDALALARRAIATARGRVRALDALGRRRAPGPSPAYRLP